MRKKNMKRTETEDDQRRSTITRTNVRTGTWYLERSMIPGTVFEREHKQHVTAPSCAARC